MARRRRSFACPHCGAIVKAGALACAGCGSDAQSGWSEDADAWAGDLPTGYDADADDDPDADADFDYEEFLRAEGLGDDRRPSRAMLRRRRTAAICLLLVVCLVLWLILR